jgi:lipoprotein-anchoring transpeptidase ErfK/SrfK
VPSRALVAAVAVAVAAAAAVTWGLTRPDGDDAPAERAAPTTTTAPPATAPPTTQPPAPAVVATVQVSEIEAFDAPAESAAVVATLSDRTDFGVARTFLVAEQQGDWLRVLLPVRPNGTTGWVRAADVTTATTTFSVKVELGAHKVTLYDAGSPVLETGAVIGASDTPTPPGTYYVTDPVDLRDDPGSAYGAFALGLSGFSDVLYEFAGGPGQLALHGTNRPDQVGQDISNGCVRVPDEVILQIAERVPLGTPVEIVA